MIATAIGDAEVLCPGTRLGRYELLTRLAVGGMAELYLARATGIEGFEKLVALKRILPQHASDPSFVSMFLDEARLAASLQHGNIAQVYDIGQTEHALFFTMEFVHGRDVRTLLHTACKRGRKVPMEHAVHIAAGAAAGLHAAHEKTDYAGASLGIVHRDVSPANVLVSFDGCVKLIDFGVAKASRRNTETRAGTLKGKVAYMSPEQCLGEEIDRRSDVFSLGIVIYELTTRKRLFAGENDFTIMRRIVEEDAPPPSSKVRGYPEELEAIVMRALARDREQRYETAQQVQLDLERFARRHNLVMSNVQLAKYMRRTFSDELEDWEQMRRGFSTGEVPAIADERVAREPNAVISIESGAVLQAVPSEVRSEAVSAPLGRSDRGAPAPSVVMSAPASRRILPRIAMASLGFAVALGALSLLFGGGTTEPSRAAPVDTPRAQPTVEQSVDTEAWAPQPAAATVTIENKPAAATVVAKPVKRAVKRKRPTRRRARKRAGWDRDSALPPM